MQDIFGGSSGSSQQQSTQTPVNLQNSAFQNLAPGVAQALQTLFQGGPAFTGPGSALGSTINTPASGVGNVQGNPLVAPLSSTQTGLVNQAGQQGAVTPNQTSANGLNAAMLDPNYAASLAGSPQTAAAITAATNPIAQAFKTQTIPGLEGQATAAGQRTNSASGQGSSAFDRAAAEAQTGEEQAIGSTAGSIANSAYQTGLQQQSQAVNQAQQLSQTQLNNTIQALQATALPQMIEQYGINQGLQLFQQRISTMLQALGLGGQVAQPVLGNQGQSTGSGDFSSSPGAFNSIGNLGTGVGNLATAFPNTFASIGLS